jgi:hypothetical protein
MSWLDDAAAVSRRNLEAVPPELRDPITQALLQGEESMNVNEYRKAVIKSIACPLCGAKVGQRCADPSGREDERPYVHDDRSAAYHQLLLSDVMAERDQEAQRAIDAETVADGFKAQVELLRGIEAETLDATTGLGELVSDNNRLAAEVERLADSERAARAERDSIVRRIERLHSEDWWVGGAWGDYGEVVIPLRALSTLTGPLADHAPEWQTDPGFAATYGDLRATMDRLAAENAALRKVAEAADTWAATEDEVATVMSYRVADGWEHGHRRLLDTKAELLAAVRKWRAER